MKQVNWRNVPQQAGRFYITVPFARRIAAVTVLPGKPACAGQAPRPLSLPGMFIAGKNHLLAAQEEREVFSLVIDRPVALTARISL